MARNKPTTQEREARVARRRTAREAAAEKISLLRDWHLARSDRATKAAKERAKSLRSQPRGVDRVPSRLMGLAITVKPHEVSKHDTPITYGPGIKATKVHRRPTRRREMPGAIARRMERNRKAWS